MKPPIAQRRPSERALHGETVVDDYSWMRDREDPEVIAHLEAENAYTDAMTAHLAPLREQIFAEIKDRTQETDLSVPAKRGDYWYSTRTEEGRPYRIWVRMDGGPDGAEIVLLDENLAAEGNDYFRLANFSVSPSAGIIGYSTDTDGGERYTTRFRDAATGRDLDDEIPNTSYGAAWASDSIHYFYTVTDAAMRPWQIWRHRLGTDASSDALVLQEDDDRYYLSVQRSRSGEYIFIVTESAVTSDARYVPADEPDAEPVVVLPRVEGVEYSVDHRGDEFWIVTNDGALDGRLLRVPVAHGDAVEVVAHAPGSKLGHPDCFADHVVVWGRHEGLPAALIVDPADGTASYLGIEESVYELGPGANYEFQTNLLRYGFESPVTPSSVFDHDVASEQRTLLKQQEVLGNYTPDDYTTRREWARAGDGALIPISVVYRSDTPIDGTAPLVVYSYGAYEISMPTRFSIPRLSLLDRGVVYAIAHVRGGGEMGKSWYEQGKLANKMNTFTDLVDAVRYLTATGYGDASRVAIRGGSAGGLTVGAAVNLDPDRFRAVVAEVPFVDVVNTMLDESLPLTVVEWEEWGNPNIEEEYGWLRAYTPYENLNAVEYPSMLITAGLNDPRVQYWEPAKWTAELRAAVTGDRPVLLKTEMGAGHFARSGRYDAWRDEAFVLAFVLDELGVDE
ncbi:MAG: S9 family peptidase [Actinomycetota bacterium]|nr:S9 family peptidase [Actinomycetota bacterium]